METASHQTVVLDHGTYNIKAGFAGQDEPSVVMKSLVGRPIDGTNSSDVYLGEEAIAKKKMLKLRRTVEWKTLINWTDTEILWQHVFDKELHSDMSECPLLMSEPSPNTKYNREKSVQVAFETFNVPAFYLASAASLALQGAGLRTGLVVDLGEGPVSVVPVYESHFMEWSVFRYQVCGADLTQALMTLLTKKEATAQKMEWEVVRDMKEKYAYVAQDFEKEMQTFDVEHEKQYSLPSGEALTLGKERFQCAETLLKPGLVGYEMPGLAEHISFTIARCDATLKQDFAGNILLTGGGALLPGLKERLEHDVQAQLNGRGLDHLKAEVLAPPDRDLLVWKGGSVLASSHAFTHMCITIEDYNEYGPTLVHRKCF
ncbi:hypothetical protein BaRGS_00024078 [Batillaria attramentaria]|uniref:Actin n=1 Tax=Batillaria attramentaria TaxID=370345 RepID=A0ABD0KCG4_9CAEN